MKVICSGRTSVSEQIYELPGISPGFRWPFQGLQLCFLSDLSAGGQQKVYPIPS